MKNTKSILISSFLLLTLLLLFSYQTYALQSSSPLKYSKVKTEEGVYKITAENDTYIMENTYRFNNLEKPRIAVALGGGGARALVHIGVLKALKEAGIPIDMMVGTSMGAIISTMYGSGIPLTQIEEIARKATFAQMFELNFPSTKSLLRTTKVNHFIEKLAPVKSVEDFPIPTAFLSYDLSAGAKYVHTSGRISDVIQSSYAIPFYFPVHHKKNHFLIDPGIVELTPAKTAKLLGADIVISSTALDKLPYDEYNNSIRALTRLIQLMQRRNSKPITENYSDIIVNNQVGNYSFMDFQLAERLIELGYQQTKKKMPEIKQLLRKKGVSLQKYKDKKRETINLSQSLKDIKYERMVIDSPIFKPLFYFGKDHSFFKQDLFKDELFTPQYGLEFSKDKLETKLLNNREEKENLELKVRAKKITPHLDIIAKSKLDSNQNDWELLVKHYAPNYSLSFGRKSINQQQFNLVKNEYDLNLNNTVLKGETSLLISPQFNSYKTLTSHQGLFKLSSIWSLKPKVVFNNTELMPSPTIYRGAKPKDSVKFQAAMDWIYTHDFLPTIEVSQVLQIKNIQCYLFSDYQTSYPESTAYGIGSKIDLNLLGVKPIHLGVYFSRDKKQRESRVGWDVNFVF